MGKGEKYKELYPKYQLGKISMTKLLTEIFHEWQGLKIEDLDKLVELIKFNINAKAALKEIKSQGIKTALLSNIPVQLSEIIKKIFNFDYVSGTVLEIVDGVFTGKILKFNYLKEIEARKILEQNGIAADEAVMIGDRRDDAKVFEILKFGISYNGDEAADSVAKYKIKNWDELPAILQSEND